jgi:hypothetical protein
LKRRANITTTFAKICFHFGRYRLQSEGTLERIRRVYSAWNEESSVRADQGHHDDPFLEGNDVTEGFVLTVTKENVGE